MWMLKGQIHVQHRGDNQLHNLKNKPIEQNKRHLNLPYKKDRFTMLRISDCIS